MKERIKLKFVDFWNGFDPRDNFFTRLISQRYEIEFSDNPDFIIYSLYGESYLNYNCYRILYNAENLRVNWLACDYAFSFDYINDPRHYRLPNWLLYDDPLLLTRPKPSPEQILKEKTGFCNFIVSNPRSEKRIEFFHKLSKYKKVDSGGRYLNNIGGPVDDKRSFVRNYKFTIAFENSLYPGYTTEKLFEPMLENSLPIYWGNPLVGRDFNPRSFINYSDYGSDEALIERIIEVDKNDDLYCQYMAEPWYHNNIMPEYLRESEILKQFEFIFENAQNTPPVAVGYKKFLNKSFIKLTHLEHLLNSVFKYRKNFR